MHFGLYPDDVPRFSMAEWNQYLDVLEQMAHERRQAERKRR